MVESTVDLNSGEDVVAYLTAQHAQIHELLDRVRDSSGEQRTEAFVTLRRLLAVHETAEEMVVHPRARHVSPTLDAVVDARLSEEHDSKIALADLESHDTDSAEFDERFAGFRDAVLAHAQAEEEFEFVDLAADVDEQSLRGMRAAVRLAQAMAPTRPHAGVESLTANLAVGPFAALLDRARDVISNP